MVVLLRRVESSRRLELLDFRVVGGAGGREGADGSGARVRLRAMVVGLARVGRSDSWVRPCVALDKLEVLRLDRGREMLDGRA